MYMKKKIIFSTAFAALMMLASCGTVSNTTPTTETTQTYEVNPVEVKSEVLNIKDALSLFDNKDLAPELAKKYGYKLEKDVNIHNLDNYKTMLYKNCLLGKKSKAGNYADLPRRVFQATSASLQAPLRWAYSMTKPTRALSTR